MAHAVTLIRGADAEEDFATLLQRVLAAAGAALEWTEFTAAEAALEGGAAVAESIRTTGCAIEAWAPAAGARPEMLPAATYLAGALELAVCVHPCRSYAGFEGARPGVDLLIWRGTTEGAYAQLELRSREPQTTRWVADLSGVAGAPLAREAGLSVLSSSRSASEQLVEGALEFARDHGRKRLMLGVMTGVLQATDGLFLHTARNVAVRYPEVEFRDWPLGDLCRELVRAPQEFDVLVVPPLWGAPLAELGAGLVGGPSQAPCFHLGAAGVALFGAAWPPLKKVCGARDHGPWGVLMSSAWMLRHLGESAAATRLDAALAELLAAQPGPGSWRALAEPLVSALS